MDIEKTYTATLKDEVINFTIRYTQNGKELEYYETDHGRISNLQNLRENGRKQIKQTIMTQTNKNQKLKNMKEYETLTINNITYTCECIQEINTQQKCNGYTNWDTWAYYTGLINDQYNLTQLTRKQIKNLTKDKLNTIYHNGIFYDCIDCNQVNVNQIKKQLLI